MVLHDMNFLVYQGRSTFYSPTIGLRRLSSTIQLQNTTSLLFLRLHRIQKPFLHSEEPP